ncbi:ABC transporter substrate-binding protein [Reyranella sp. CPCC 100927]|uniref:ABC transporter substrate-binding protein n=1 Tax=Reyranella sp. CPCC 100927 TaxID=2599616 RepID=UPI0021052373|nr:ABC transporter substrate-binding protein [Reyranella sp. CPCC 100927]
MAVFGRMMVVAAGVAAGLALSASALAQSTLRVVMHSDLKSFDPVWSGAYIVRNHGYLVWDTLFAMDEKFQIKPQMVDKYAPSDDGLTWTFTLRDGLEWHDGTPVTAEDCIASLKRWAARDSMGQKLAQSVKTWEVVDAKTFRLVLKDQFGQVVESLGKPSVVVPFIMPKRMAETDAFKAVDEVIGSGPFIFKKDEWKPGEKVVYVKNPKYKPRAEPASGLAGGKVVKLDRVEWVWIPDPQTQVNALIAGEVDMIESVANDLVPLLEKEKDVTLIKQSVGNQYTFRPNWLIPPFNNPKIRQAAMMALNQEDFLKGIIGDPRYWRTCKTIFPCGSPLATDAGMAGWIEGNAAKAKQMLQEAGYDGTTVVIPYPTDLQVIGNMGPIAKSLLERAGFKVEVQPADWQSMVNRLISKKGPPSEGGWSAYLTSWSHVDILDPLMAPMLVSTCDKARAGWPCDEKMEKLRDAYARELDPAKKKAIAEEVQAYNREIVTYVNLGEWFGVSAVRKNVSMPAVPPPVTAFWGIEKK